MMISHGTASADLTAFVHAKMVSEMADALVDDTVDLGNLDAVASCLIARKFGGRAIGDLMVQAIDIARGRLVSAA
jgi:hypothetical protein